MKSRWIFISAACLALNLTMGKIAALLCLPIYFDTIGTILGAVLLPPFYALSLAAMTSLLAGIVINPYFVAFTGSQLAIALVAIGLCRVGCFSAWWKSVLAGALLALVSVAVSTPVSVLLFGGVSLSGTTAVNALLLATGHSLWKSVICGAMLVESIDKPASTFLVWLVLRRLPGRLGTPACGVPEGEP